VGCVEATLL